MRRHSRPGSKPSEKDSGDDASEENNQIEILNIDQNVEVEHKSGQVIISYNEFNENSESYNEFLENC